MDKINKDTMATGGDIDNIKNKFYWNIIANSGKRTKKYFESQEKAEAWGKKHLKQDDAAMLEEKITPNYDQFILRWRSGKFTRLEDGGAVAEIEKEWIVEKNADCPNYQLAKKLAEQNGFHLAKDISYNGYIFLEKVICNGENRLELQIYDDIIKKSEPQFTQYNWEADFGQSISSETTYRFKQEHDQHDWNSPTVLEAFALAKRKEEELEAKYQKRKDVEANKLPENAPEIKTREQFFDKYKVRYEDVLVKLRDRTKRNTYAYPPLATAMKEAGVTSTDLPSKWAFTRIFLSEQLPSKLFKDKIEEDALPVEEVKIAPIFQKPQLKDNSLESKIESLKGIVAEDLARNISYVYLDADNKNIVATDALKMVIIKDDSIKKNELVMMDVGMPNGSSRPRFKADKDLKYPNYKAVIPKDNPFSMKIDVQDMLNKTAGVARANHFFDSEVGITVKIKIGEKIWYFNPELLHDVLKVFAMYGKQEAAIELSRPNRGAVIKEGEVFGLVMPINGDAVKDTATVTLVDRDYTEDEKAKMAEWEHQKSVEDQRGAVETAERDLKYEMEYQSKNPTSDKEAQEENKLDLERAQEKLKKEREKLAELQGSKTAKSDAENLKITIADLNILLELETNKKKKAEIQQQISDLEVLLSLNEEVATMKTGGEVHGNQNKQETSKDLFFESGEFIIKKDDEKYPPYFTFYGISGRSVGSINLQTSTDKNSLKFLDANDYIFDKNVNIFLAFSSITLYLPALVDGILLNKNNRQNMKIAQKFQESGRKVITNSNDFLIHK